MNTISPVKSKVHKLNLDAMLSLLSLKKAFQSSKKCGSYHVDEIKGYLPKLRLDIQKNQNKSLTYIERNNFKVNVTKLHITCLQVAKQERFTFSIPTHSKDISHLDHQLNVINHTVNKLGLKSIYLFSE